MTLPGYRARIQIGAHVWTVDAGAPAAYGPALPLRSGWTMTPGEPSYPGPITETVSIPLVCADHTIPDSITIGDPIEVLIAPAGVDPDPAAPDTLIWGQWTMVADLSVSPHPLGLLVTVNGAGWNSTLPGLGSSVYTPAGTDLVNLTLYAFDTAGQAWTRLDPDYAEAVAYDFLLTEEPWAWVTLEARATRYTTLLRHSYFQPAVTRGLPGGPSAGWAVRTCSRPTPAQADLLLVGGAGTVVPRAATAANAVIPAALVPTDLEWSRTRDATPTRWAATYVTAVPGTPPADWVEGPTAEIVLDTTPTNTLPRVYQIDTGASDLVHALIPDFTPAASDLARAWIYEAAAAGEVPGLYRTASLGLPLTTAGAVAALPRLWLNWLSVSSGTSPAPVLDRGIVVTGLGANMRPTGRSWFAGRCIGAQLTIDPDPAEGMGRVTLTLDLTPTLPVPPTAAGRLAWSGVPVMTWDVTPVTWHDLRLV